MGRRFKFFEAFSDIKNCVFSINKMIFWYQKFDYLIPFIFWFVNKMSDIKKSFLVSKIRSFDFRKWLFDIRYSKWFLYHKLLIPEKNFRYQKIEFRTDQNIIKPIWWYQELFFDMKKIFFELSISKIYFLISENTCLKI